MEILTKWEYDTYQGHHYCGVYIDIEEGKRIIKEEDKPYQEIDKLLIACSECYVEHWDREEDPEFKNKDTCSRACVKTDRNGLYCENRLSEYDNPHNHYYGVVCETLD